LAEIIIKVDEVKKIITEFKAPEELNPIQIAVILNQCAIQTISSLEMKKEEKKIIVPNKIIRRM